VSVVRVVLALSLLLAAPALAQSRGSEPLHGWTVLRIDEGESDPGAGSRPERFALAHVPPRSPVATGDGRFLQASKGEIRLVSPLRVRPDWIVPSGRRCYLFFGEREPGRRPDGGAGQPGRGAGLAVMAVPSALGDTWSTDATSRLSSAPALPSGDVVALTGFELGPAPSVGALISVEDELRLFVLDGAGWAEVGLPEMAGAVRPDFIHLYGEDLAIIDRSTGRCWTGSISPGSVETKMSRPGFPFEPSDRTPPEAKWEEDESYVGWAVGGGGRLFWLGGSIIEVLNRGDGLDVQLLSGSSSVEVGSVDGKPVDWVVVGSRGSERLVALVEQADGEAQEVRSQDPRSRLRVIELSLLTGAIWYDGPVRSAPPVSPGEFRLLALVILGVMVLALLFVLRPDGDGGVAVLPPETSLCEPGRRLGAGLADLLIALLGGSVISGLVSGEASFSFENPMALVCAAVVFFAHGVFGEWLGGRTIGKALTGCQVVSSAPKDVRVGSWSLSLTQAITRNLFKLVLPPIALLGATDRTRRHRGDVLARTSVVTPIPPDAGG